MLYIYSVYARISNVVDTILMYLHFQLTAVVRYSYSIAASTSPETHGSLCCYRTSTQSSCLVGGGCRIPVVPVLRCSILEYGVRYLVLCTENILHFVNQSFYEVLEREGEYRTGTRSNKSNGME